MIQERTCPGKCCAVFSYLDPAVERFDATLDSAFIKDMLVPLDLMSAAERLVELGIEPTYGGGSNFDWGGFLLSDPERRLFTCRHWDTQTRLCTVYDERPEMCRAYPYGAECNYGCGYGGCNENSDV